MCAIIVCVPASTVWLCVHDNPSCTWHILPFGSVLVHCFNANGIRSPKAQQVVGEYIGIRHPALFVNAFNWHCCSVVVDGCDGVWYDGWWYARTHAPNIELAPGQSASVHNYTFFFVKIVISSENVVTLLQQYWSYMYQQAEGKNTYLEGTIIKESAVNLHLRNCANWTNKWPMLCRFFLCVRSCVIPFPFQFVFAARAEWKHNTHAGPVAKIIPASSRSNKLAFFITKINTYCFYTWNNEDIILYMILRFAHFV